MHRRIEYHYHRPGRGETVFDEVLIIDEPDLKVTLLEAYEGQEVRTGNEVILEAGAPIVWFVIPGAWHNVGRFHLADGTFTGWYTNLCTPVELGERHWSCTDLFLDLWQRADDGAPRWLDEDQFRNAVDTGLLDGTLAARVVAERRAITARLERRAWPPEVTREVDLIHARRLAAKE